jgi:2-keto-4-pentenoate hydratase/2-oxohepta-3-ene-1,7-dioic acid hydratase in catechol pathway
MSAAGQKKYCRFAKGGTPTFGRIDGDTIHVLSGSPLAGGKETGEKVALAGAKLLAPLVPRNILCVGLNYKSHIGDRKESEVPGIFLKGPNTLLDPGAPIPYPRGVENVHMEAELVVVIGKAGKYIAPADAASHIFGLTCGNDVSARPWQRGDLQWTRGKSSDGFGPIGPWIVTGLDYSNILVEGRVNGKVTQSERTGMLIHPIDKIISFISQAITLEPGDIIFTGTPGTTPEIRVGDTVDVTVEGIGTLSNPVGKA